MVMAFIALPEKKISQAEDFGPHINLTERHLNNNQPFYILPMVEGCYELDSGKLVVGKNLAFRLTRLIDQFEKGGAAGKIRMGITVNLSPMMFFYQTDRGEIKFDFQALTKIFESLGKTHLPVAVYLSLNHFIPHTPVVEVLMNNQSNLMRYQDGSVPQDTYFATKIIPFTYDLSDDLSINKYRFDAVRHICACLSKFIKEHPEQVVGITLAGEIHHLFPNLMTGPGQFEDIEITDYCDASVESFKKWLCEKFETIAEFNKTAGTSFKTWDKIDPPRRNIRVETLRGFWDHFDSYAGGILPVFGWIYDSKGIQQINIYVDGDFTGIAQYKQNRMDVYEAINDIGHPNVGFRYELDFSKLKNGIHTLDVVAVTKTNEKIFIGKRDFVYGNPQQKPPEDFRKSLNTDKMEKIKTACIDSPRGMLDVYYNPYAKLWNKFRGFQIETYINHLARLCIENGVPQNLLFSHELWPDCYSSWNNILFAIPQSFFSSHLYQPGITLYGGQRFDSIADITQNRPYAVPEFHPLQADTAIIYQLFADHYNSGAVFISPYFISILENKPRPTAHKKMLINSDNTMRGSDLFYQVIKDLCQY